MSSSSSSSHPPRSNALDKDDARVLPDLFTTALGVDGPQNAFRREPLDHRRSLTDESFKSFFDHLPLFKGYVNVWAVFLVLSISFKTSSRSDQNE